MFCEVKEDSMIKRTVEIVVIAKQGEWLQVEIDGKKFILKQVEKFYSPKPKVDLESVFG
jgi:tRNA U38,U39,U40 pseudouridine synthase TruA